MRTSTRLLTICMFFLACRQAVAADAIQIVATPTGGGAPVESSGSRFLPQLKDLTQSRGAFSGLAGQPFNATVRYGGVPSALQLSENAGHTSATLSSRLSGLKQQFTAPSVSALQSQVTDFVQTSTPISRYNAAIDRNSVFGVIDGNPRSATAFLAEDAYFRWGQDPSTEGTSQLGRNLNLRFDTTGGGMDAHGFSGYYYTAALGLDWQFTEPVGIALSVPFEYRQLAGTNTYIAGANLGIPINIIQMKQSGFGWRLTPFASTWGAFSDNLVAGGFFVTGGAVSSLRYRIGSFQATLMNEATYNGGVPLTIGSINYETRVEQWLFKNGVQLAYAISDPLQVDTSVTYSNYAHAAAIPDWWTLQMGINWRFTDRSGVRVAYQGDFGPGYTTNGGTVSLYLRF